METSKTCDQGVVRAVCDHEYVETTNKMLDFICEQCAAFSDGQVFPYYWADIVIKKHGSHWQCYEPDYADMSSGSYNTDVSHSLSVVQKQLHLLALAKASYQTIRYTDRVVTTETALAAPFVYLERKGKLSENSSGWYIGSTYDETPSQSQLIAIPSYELITRRPGLLVPLALPTGYLVEMFNADVQRVYDENNVLVWAGEGET